MNSCVYTCVLYELRVIARWDTYNGYFFFYSGSSQVIVRCSDSVPREPRLCCVFETPTIDPNPYVTHGMVPEVIPGSPRVKSLGACKLCPAQALPRHL